MSVQTKNQGWLVLAGFLLASIGTAVQPAQPGPAAQNDDGPIVITQTLPTPPVVGNADSNNRMIAVTGTDITGASILYLIDTIDPHISIYQANGGSSSSRGVSWIGARKIDLDLQVDGWNDKSDLQYEDLEKRFAQDQLAEDDER